MDLLRFILLFYSLFIFARCVEVHNEPIPGKCSTFAFDGRPNEWESPLKQVGGSGYYTEDQCRMECEKTIGCGWFRIKKSSSVPYGACQLYTTATKANEHLHNFMVYKLVTCESRVEMKGATSSSVYGNNPANWGPLLAWKGQSRNSIGYFHSIHEANPWLQIEFTKLEKLASVTIINRISCCGERLRNVQIRAGLNSGLSNEVVGEFKGPGKSGGIYEIPFKGAVTARYISFQIIGSGILQINGLRFKRAPKGKVCDASGTSLSEFASNEFKRCDEAILKHKAMCNDQSIKQACPCTCAA